MNIIDLIHRSIEIKNNVVLEDPKEKNVRKVLNWGHTIGHGVEAASNYRLRHGEAIGIGLYGEALLAEQIWIADPGLSSNIEKKLASLGLPTKCPGLNTIEIKKLMSTDKKKNSVNLYITLPTSIGAVEYGVQVEDNILTKTIERLTE